MMQRLCKSPRVQGEAYGDQDAKSDGQYDVNDKGNLADGPDAGEGVWLLAPQTS